MARSPPSRRHDERREDRGFRRRSRSREHRRDDRDRDRHRDRPRRDDDRYRDNGFHQSSRRRDDRGSSRYDDRRDGYRERSRERRLRLSREPSPVRDDRHGHRRMRDDDTYGDRDSKRPRRNSQTRSDRSSRPTTADPKQHDNDAEKVAEAKLQQERMARLEAWRKRKAEEKQLDTATSSAGPNSPMPSNPTTVLGSPNPEQDGVRSSSPGRAPFDPKAIKKRVENKMKAMKATLGDDIAIPAATNGTASELKSTPRTGGQAITTVKPAEAKITGFELNKTAGNQTADPASKAAADFDEEDQVQRKITKLPELPQSSLTGNTAPASDEEDDDAGADDLHSSDEGEAQATREAALKRAEEAQAEQQDVKMAEAADPSSTNAASTDIDEDVDPLDAFMNDLDQKSAPPVRSSAKRGGRTQQLFDEDDGPDLDAVGENPEDLLNNPKRKRKEIPDVDHSKINYEDFRKNFYSESIEVADMTQEDVDTLRVELDNITVRGQNPPKPITKWSQCGFAQQVLDIIKQHKFETPTSIQCQALPAIMSGRDTIGIAKTGSGKTLAFILPMFRHIKDQRPVSNQDGPIGLIMAPTRELAVQIHRECKPYLKALNLRGVCAYGGSPIKDQIAELKRGAEVVVCTPGRLIDLLAANAGRVTNLKRVTYVVMDEADRMFDMGFEPQITKLLNNMRPDRQTVLFSATFPAKMERLARKALTRPVEILVGGRSVVAAEITQIIEVRPEDTKFNRVLQLIGDLYERDEDARTLIFVERQETADLLFKQISKMGYPCLPVHGGREQMDRDQAIAEFKAGAIPIMVATSVAARGLDVKQLKLVINYDSPNHGEDYVHRAGRTGRAGNTGTAVTFITPEQERFAPFLVRALEDSKQEVPADMKKLAESHKKKVESGEARDAGSGFGGRGIDRLDAARAAERAWEKGLFKTGDEPEEEDKETQEKSKKETAVSELVAKAAGAIKDRGAPSEKPAEKTADAESAAAENSVTNSNLAVHLSNALKVQKVAKPPPTPAATDPLSKAAAAAATINSRIGRGATRSGAPADNRGPDAGEFHATLEINDFPQMARWAVTNRTNVSKILDSTGTSITTKGNHYQLGYEPQAHELPKLYILVEGDTEVAVSAAMRELSRHLTEGMMRAQEQESRGTMGKYKVL
ncbi:Pre-mRNA-processing ATP-dependent RNA helicase prp5 [Lecanosticta acicola]|uniref:RNA helicase n=1 Tax=Lecanosticta acicola TaxID=111012 RepID=A0AAI9EBM1_9PEZI|nr:Pre-mRNA-processing ATP-dependent RNA helicase prp5 [Lecanosticta acicola]